MWEKPLNFLKILFVVTLKTMPLGIIPGCGLRGLASSVQGYKPIFEEKKIAIQPQIELEIGSPNRTL